MATFSLNPFVAFEACWKCNISIDNDQYLRCPKCNGTYHNECVRKNNNTPVWTCERCLEKNEMPVQRQDDSRKSTRSVRSKATSSSSSKSSNVEHELFLLDEQKKLMEKQFREREEQMAAKHKQEQLLLDQRMELLRSSRSSRSSESVRSKSSSMKSREKVESWNTVGFSSSAREQIQSTVAQHTQPNPPIQNAATFTVKNRSARNEFGNTNPVSHFPIYESSFISKSGLAARHVMGNRLPHFDGDPMKWPGFVSQFNTSTQVCELTDAENLVRLDESIKGNARIAVEGLLYLPGNVPTIIEVLRKLFGRPEFVVNALISRINGSAKPLQPDQFEEIIAFSTQVSNVVTHMKQASMSDYLWNPLLMQQLVDKMPCQFKVEWASYRSKLEHANLEVFSSWLDEKAMSLTCILSKPPQFTKQKYTKGYVQFHGNVVDADISKCCVCEGICKNVASCEKFKNMNYTARWETVHQKELCRICLQQHKGRCKSGNKCQAPGCNFMHHTLLHRNSSTPDSNEIPPTGIVNLHRRDSGPSLLKIVPVKLFGCNQKVVETFALLDDGSSLTLLEHSVAEELGLHGPVKPICLQWTNDKKRTEPDSRCVDLSISGSSSEMKFDLWNVHTVKNLSLPIQTVDMDELKKEFHYLKKIEMSSYRNAKPTILILDLVLLAKQDSVASLIL